MSDIIHIHADKAPEPGPYSHAVRYQNLLFLSGQVSEDPETGEVINGTVAEQTDRILRNLQLVLEAAGSSMEKVLKVTIYLTDITSKPEMNEVYTRYFTGKMPARVAVGIKELDDGLAVEMDAIAVVE